MKHFRSQMWIWIPLWGVLATALDARAQTIVSTPSNFQPLIQFHGFDPWSYFNPAQSTGRSRVYAGAEFLLWSVNGVDLPPLVTSNPLGTSADDAGIIGASSTSVLFGGTVLDDAREGYRISGGFRLTDRVAIEGRYFELADEDFSATFDSSLGLILGRPYIELTPDTGPIRYETQLFEFPPLFEGSVNIRGRSSFRGGGLGVRLHVLQPRSSCGCAGPCTGTCAGQCDSMLGFPLVGCWVDRLSVYVGYRTLRLDESLRIDERLVDPADTFDIVDAFEADSRFDGIEFGLEYGGWYKNVGFGTYGRLSAGLNSNSVGINGSTTIDGVLQADPGGILTQRTNIGRTHEDVAAFSAQFGFNFYARLTPCLTANVGYSGLYWSNVVRAGEQIDLNVSGDLFPPVLAATPAGTIGAQRTGTTSDLFAHGLNAGLTFAF
ncbi:MAG: BBP7 family outer membrane beta-barrel protein [Planctomycetota bacterium]